MAHFEKDEVEMLSETHAQLYNEVVDSNVSMTPSASISIPLASLKSYEETSPVGHTSPLCSVRKPPKFYNALYGDARNFGRKLFSFCSSYVPGIMNARTQVVQQWFKIWIIFCMMANFVDPLFFFLIHVKTDGHCIAINRTMTTVLVSIRSMNDLVYFFNILLQFRLAYPAPGSRVVGAGVLVDDPKKIALKYLKGYFFIDLFVVFPFPQIMILFVLPHHLVSSFIANAGLVAVVISGQYFLRLFRIWQIERLTHKFILGPAWAIDIENLLIFMLSCHVVGCSWYLFGLQRVYQCLRVACLSSDIMGCSAIINCGFSYAFDQKSYQWYNNSNAIACLDSSSGVFSYGIYEDAVPLVMEYGIVNKYVFALFWGFQQVITLADNLTPSYFVWEVVFTMNIMALGLCFFVFLIGNIQCFLQTLRHRMLEMELRNRDVEQWMSDRRIPEDLRRRVRQAERYNWAATKGVNEEMLLEKLPEDLQTDIRRHLFKFVKRVPIFSLMDEPILDAICERLKQKTYIKGSKVLSQGGLIEKMVFVVRGKLESFGDDGTIVPLSEGDACGEELLTWYLERASVSVDGKKVRVPGRRLVSHRTIRCLTNVDSFSLRLADLEDLTILFPGFLQNPCFQGPIRYVSRYWRLRAAKHIQVAWRNRKKRLSHASTSQSDETLESWVVV